MCTSFIVDKTRPRSMRTEDFISEQKQFSFFNFQHKRVRVDIRKKMHSPEPDEDRRRTCPAT